MTYLPDFFADLAQFLLVLLNIEPGDSAHRKRQKFVDIIVGDIAQQQVTERCQSGVDFPVFIFLTAALFDLFVDTVFKEYLSERFGVMQFILPVEVDFQFPLQIAYQFFHIAPENLTYAHLHGFPVTYHHDARRYGDGTIGVHVQPLQRLFRRVTACGRDLYMNVVSGKIIHTGNSYFVLFRRAFNGCHQRFGGTACRNLPDDEVTPFDIDFCPENDPAVTVIIFADIHQRALLEVGIKFKRSALKYGNFGIKQFVEVVRQYARRHTDGDTVTSQHQQTWKFGRKHDRFFFSSVVIGDKRRDIVVEHRLVREFGQTALRITSGGGGAAGKNISEVTLFDDKVGDVEIFSFLLTGLPVAETVLDDTALVGKHHECIADGGISVRMEMHGIADDIGYFLRSAVVNPVQRPQNTALNRLESVVHIGNGA